MSNPPKALQTAEAVEETVAVRMAKGAKGAEGVTSWAAATVVVSPVSKSANRTTNWVLSTQKKLNAVNLMPTNCRYPICIDWIYVGRECTKPYGTCNKVHDGFDQTTCAADKKIIADHVTNTKGIWFNKNSVRSLTEQSHKLNSEVPLVLVRTRHSLKNYFPCHFV